MKWGAEILEYSQKSICFSLYANKDFIFKTISEYYLDIQNYNRDVITEFCEIAPKLNKSELGLIHRIDRDNNVVYQYQSEIIELLCFEKNESAVYLYYTDELMKYTKYMLLNFFNLISRCEKVLNQKERILKY